MKPCDVMTRTMLYCIGIYWIRIDRPEFSYEKWLGPDWEKTYDGASTIIWNHGSWIDILVGMLWDLPSFVSKS